MRPMHCNSCNYLGHVVGGGEVRPMHCISCNYLGHGVGGGEGRPMHCNICNYLGHVVGGGEVRPMHCKVKAVKVYERPKTKKQVRAFLGLCGNYHRFIPSFSTVANSWTELTRKNKENVVKWNETCEHSFNLLKEALMSKPVLTTPDWTWKFILQTDASNTGLGYVRRTRTKRNIQLHMDQRNSYRESKSIQLKSVRD